MWVQATWLCYWGNFTLPPKIFPQSDLRHQVDSCWALHQISSLTFCLLWFSRNNPKMIKELLSTCLLQTKFQLLIHCTSWDIALWKCSSMPPTWVPTDPISRFDMKSLSSAEEQYRLDICWQQILHAMIRHLLALHHITDSQSLNLTNKHKHETWSLQAPLNFLETKNAQNLMFVSSFAKWNLTWMDRYSAKPFNCGMWIYWIVKQWVLLMFHFNFSERTSCI